MQIAEKMHRRFSVQLDAGDCKEIVFDGTTLHATMTSCWCISLSEICVKIQFIRCKILGRTTLALYEVSSLRVIEGL